MTTKKSKNEAKKKPAPKKLENEILDARIATMLASFRSAFPPGIDKRKELLARVAGSIAAGLVTAPSPSIASPSSMATAAVDIAEAILKQAGIPSIEPSAESASPGRDVGVGAAS